MLRYFSANSFACVFSIYIYAHIYMHTHIYELRNSTYLLKVIPNNINLPYICKYIPKNYISVFVIILICLNLQILYWEQSVIYTTAHLGQCTSFIWTADQQCIWNFLHSPCNIFKNAFIQYISTWVGNFLQVLFPLDRRPCIKEQFQNTFLISCISQRGNRISNWYVLKRLIAKV